MSKPKIFLALDVDSKNEAMHLAELWGEHICGVKVGPRLGFQLNAYEWKALSQKAKVFVDYKFYDIPSTVESSIKQVFKTGASFCTVHALNGRVCLKRLASLERLLNQERDFKILVVTLLTSYNQTTNALPLSEARSPQKIVQTLATEAVEAGLTGLVCSSYESSYLSKLHPNLSLVTPGIRFSWDKKDDQSRVLDPEAAWKNGAEYLVMGRSLIRAGRDEKAFVDAKNEIKRAWQTVK